MTLFDWVEEKIHVLKWYDMSLIKLSSAAFVLMVAVLWPPLTSLEWYWYGLVFVLASIVPGYKFFK